MPAAPGTQRTSMLGGWDGPTVCSNGPLFSFANALTDFNFIDFETGYQSPPRDLDSIFSSPLSSVPASPSSSPLPLDQDQFVEAVSERLSSLVPKHEPPTPSSATTFTTVTAKRGRDEDVADDVGPTDAQLQRKAKKKKQKHANYRAKRAAEHRKSFSHHTSRPAIEKKYVDTTSSIKTAAAMKDVKENVASSSYIGTSDKKQGKKAQMPLEKLVGEGSKYKFQYVEWNGRDPIPIISSDGYLLGILAGNPDPADWPRIQKEAADALEDARQRCEVDAKDRSHRRGKFTTLRCGVSHGGGPTKPSNASNNKVNAAILEELNNKEAFRRISGFTDSVMSVWAPDLHAHYADCLNTVHKNDPTLRRIFPSSVFASTTYNLGPRTYCCRHRDFGNIPYGWCGITALGSYDYTKGGHLVLWDLELVIEFPPGATVLIPSAIVAHSNVPIAKNETRYSFTQYTAGGLFRWVDHGCQKVESYVNAFGDDEAARAAYIKEMEGRWEAVGLSLTPRRA